MFVFVLLTKFFILALHYLQPFLLSLTTRKIVLFTIVQIFTIVRVRVQRVLIID